MAENQTPQLPQPHPTQDLWGDELNEWLLTGHNPDGTNKDVVTVEDLDPLAQDISALQVNKADAAVVTGHTSDTGNPHSVTAAQVGLGNVDNTSDADKPVSSATQASLDAKQPKPATAGRWYQLLRQGVNDPEWVDPAGMLAPMSLLSPDGSYDRAGAVSPTASGAVRLVEGSVPGSQAWFVEEGTTNLIPNPQFNTGGAAWSVSTAGAQSTVVTKEGIPSYEITSTVAGMINLQRDTAAGSLAAGESVTFSGYMRSSHAGVTADVGIAVRDGAGVSLSVVTSTLVEMPVNGWSRYTVSISSLPADSSYATVYFRPRPTAAGQKLWHTQPQLEKKSYATSYCDGSLGPGYTWSGTTHASISRRAPGDVQVDTGSSLPFTEGEIALRCRLTDMLESSYVLYHYTGGTRYELRYQPSTESLMAGFGDLNLHTSASGTVRKNTWLMLNVRLSGGRFSVFVDGKSIIDAPRGSTPPQSGVLRIGRGGDNANGNYESLLIFDRPLTDRERKQLMASAPWSFDSVRVASESPTELTSPSTLLGFFPPNRKIAAGGTTLRTAPDTTAPTITTLAAGTDVHSTGQALTASSVEYTLVMTQWGQGFVPTTALI